MATDFFERQSVARRHTGRLVWLFILAVVGILGATYAATWAACVYLTASQGGAGRMPPDLELVPLYAALAALCLIVLGSLYKIAQLRGGGTVVAEQVGGKRIYPNTADLTERRVLNVVEEMALASGVPVPPVYMLSQEQGINAFAAGYSPSDAVVAVTRGCAEQLSRDELQGVIAHEFSHILNGDMRLNIRLIGILHGILLLGLAGQILFRIMAYSGHGRSRNDRGSGGIVIVVILVGLAMIILGYVGTVMGNLIKAAVSRQREYLADASAVQFTRNPDGIGGALKKIGGLVFGSRLKSPNAAEASHMYFAEGVRSGLTSLLSTHPPLADRIRRIDPQWDGKYPRIDAEGAAAVASAQAAAFAGDEIAAMRTVPTDVVEHASDQVGEPQAIHRLYAAELVKRLPEEVVAAAHEPYGARAVLYCLLLDRDADVRQKQLAALQKLATADVFELTLRLVPAIVGIDVRVRLPLVDMSLPALRAMSPQQYRTFTQCFQELVKADDRLGLFEWSLHHILLRHLKPQFEPVKSAPTRYYGLKRLSDPCSVFLSTLAYVGHDDKVAARAFALADDLLTEVRVQLLPRVQCNLHHLQRALEELQHVAPKLRRRLIDAAAACICADREVTVGEAELLRAVCDMLDCPMPPLLPGQAVEPVTRPPTPAAAATR